MVVLRMDSRMFAHAVPLDDTFAARAEGTEGAGEGLLSRVCATVPHKDRVPRGGVVAVGTAVELDSAWCGTSPSRTRHLGCLSLAASIHSKLRW